tara:strand:+ start:1609 stop:2658 length:1050 start_codon:yes stop_codon:yes gene_type:complete
MRNKTLLITGAGGWLGNSINIILAERINKLPYKKIILSSLRKSEIISQSIFKDLCKSEINFEIIQGNLKDDQFYKNLYSKVNRTEPLEVVYASSLIHPNKSSDFYKVNNGMLKKFVKSISTYNLKRFIYISSNSPHGFNNNLIPFDEESKYKPIGNYGVSKMKAELFLLNYFHNNELTILKAPWFHGLGMPERQKEFIRKTCHGFFPLVFPGINRRSIVNTIDLSKAIFNILESKEYYSKYWICEKNSISMREYLNLIQDSAFKQGFINFPRNRTFNKIILPPLTSLFFSKLDMLLQYFGIYSKYIHILGEIGMNIEATPELYNGQFYEHQFEILEKTIDDEVVEAFSN